MPRRSQFPPPIRLHRARQLERSWWQGRWHYLGPVGSAEARAAYAALLAEIAAGRESGRRPAAKGHNPIMTLPTVSDVLSRWLAEEGPSACTERGRELEQFRLSFRPLERLLGDTPAAGFGADALLALRRHCCGLWCRKVVNQRLGRVRRVWAWAELVRLVPPGSYAALQAVRPLRRGTRAAREGPGRRPATLADVRAVGRHLAGRHLHAARAMLLVQWWTGMRSAEVREMRAGDVDTSGEVWLYRPRRHKTDYLGHPRLVAVGPKARSALRPWLDRARRRGPAAVVFPPARRRKGVGSLYTATNYGRAVHKSAVAVGLPWFSPYSCRHGARDRIAGREGDRAAQHVLGHATILTTQGYGTRHDPGHAADVQRRLG
jgi:integrase